MDKYVQPINPSPAVGVPINHILYLDPTACSGIRSSSFLSRNESLILLADWLIKIPHLYSLLSLPRIASRRDPFPRLSLREGEVWDLYAHGMSHADIARCLTIELSTVRTHIKRARSKLGLAGLRKDHFTAASNVQRKR